MMKKIVPAAFTALVLSLSATSIATAATYEYRQTVATMPVAAPVVAPVLGAFSVPSKTAEDIPFNLTAPTSTSSGSWSYTSSNPAVATIAGNTVTVKAAGKTLITATQAAVPGYSSANVTAELTVAVPPPKNYATWNPAGVTSSIAFSNGNLTTTGGGEWPTRGLIGTLGKSSGKWYWEVTIADASNRGIGVATASWARRMWGASTDSVGQLTWNRDAQLFLDGPGGNSIYPAGLTSYTTGDVLGFALDADARTLSFYKKGVFQHTASLSGAGPWYPAMWLNTYGVTHANFGATSFSYQPPAGFNKGLY